MEDAIVRYTEFCNYFKRKCPEFQQIKYWSSISDTISLPHPHVTYEVQYGSSLGVQPYEDRYLVHYNYHIPLLGVYVPDSVCELSWCMSRPGPVKDIYEISRWRRSDGKTTEELLDESNAIPEPAFDIEQFANSGNIFAQWSPHKEIINNGKRYTRVDLIEPCLSGNMLKMPGNCFAIDSRSQLIYEYLWIKTRKRSTKFETFMDDTVTVARIYHSRDTHIVFKTNNGEYTVETTKL